MFSPDLTFKSSLLFDLGKLMENSEGFYDILTSSYITKLRALPIEGIFQVTTQRFRPDLISSLIYNGQEQYKIILMLYNGITSYKEIVPGIKLKYPALTDLQSLLFDQEAKN